MFCLGFCALFEFEFRAVWEKRKEEREENGLLYIYLCTTVVLSSCPEKYGANFSRIRILDENDFAFAADCYVSARMLLKKTNGPFHLLLVF